MKAHLLLVLMSLAAAGWVVWTIVDQVQTILGSLAHA
jgi:hypothetical protein